LDDTDRGPIVHELSIVETLIEQVAQEVAAAGQTGRIKRLDLSVGRLSGVNVESLKFAFEVLSPATLVADATLAVNEPRAQGHCRECGARFETDEFLPTCTECHSSHVQIQGGQDLVLESIELAEEEEECPS
jgi:hydrogenase nickel incorporation protein HypA/HybF